MLHTERPLLGLFYSAQTQRCMPCARSNAQQPQSNVVSVSLTRRRNKKNVSIVFILKTY